MDNSTEEADMVRNKDPQLTEEETLEKDHPELLVDAAIEKVNELLVDAAIEKVNEEKGSIETETIKQESFTNAADVSVDPNTIQLLTDGFITKFLPSLQRAKTTIDQIKTSQSVLTETVQQEISKFTECQALTELDKTMAKAKMYHNKLMKLRKEMTNLHEKSRKLKKRALKLQQQKQKEELTRAHNLEKEYEKERLLNARLAPASE